MNIDYLVNQNVEIFTRNNKTTSINIFNDSLRSIDIAYIKKHLLKSKINNKYVSLSTESLDNPKKLLKLLKNNASLVDNMDESSFASEEVTTNKKLILEKNKEITKQLLPLYKKYKKEYKNLYTFNIYYTENYNELSIINKVLSSNDITLNYNIYIELILKKEDITHDGFINILSTNFNIEDINNKIKDELEIIESKFNSEECLTGVYDAILTNTVVNKILNQFIGMFSAKNINDKTSILENQFNKTIFCKNINIFEDPNNDLYPGKRLFDTEGTKTYYKDIIKNGKFIQKLYDNQTALKDNTISTGNSYGTRNLILKPGKDKLKINQGFIITNVEGMHAGINNLSGEISLQAQGYYINKNKKIFIKSFIISSNIIKLLSSVKKIGNDIDFYNESIACPSLLIENINISGSKKE